MSQRAKGDEALKTEVQRVFDQDFSVYGVRKGDEAPPCPLDHVNRQFHAPAPNRLCLSGFTYVATWPGFVCVAFLLDAYPRRIVGWRVSRTAHTGFVLDALEQALHERRPLAVSWC